MSEVFRTVLNAGFQGSIVIVMVILLRMALKRAPKKYICLLWILVGVRLLLPFNFESVLSLQPAEQIVSQKQWQDLRDYGGIINENAPMEVPQPHSPVQQSGVGHLPESAVITRTELSWAAAPLLWLTGVGLLGIYSLISWLLLKRRVREAVHLADDVWECAGLGTAFILGYLRPRIYIPMNISAQSRRHILKHERYHLKRFDHWVKLIGFIALTIHWFNPLVWGFYLLLCRDIEMACDEAAVRDMSLEERKGYSAALLECSAGRMHWAACPVAFGEVSVRQRILGVLNYRRPRFWLTLLAAVAIVFVTVCFLTSPVERIDPLKLEDWGITMTAMDPSATGVTAAIEIPENLDGNIVIQYSSWVLQVYANGEWEEVPMLEQEDDYPWNGHVSTVSSDDEAHCAKLDWSTVYGELEPGKYRIRGTLELIQDGLGWNKDFYGEFQIEADDAPEWGIALRTEHVTAEGLSLSITQSGTLALQELYYGQDYFLERWNEDGWEAVEPIIENWGFTMEAIQLSQNQTTRLDIDWEWLYGQLPAGTYRIGKSIHNDVRVQIGVNPPRVEQPEERTYTYYAEFTVPGVRSASEAELLAYCRSGLEGWQMCGSCVLVCSNEVNVADVLNRYSVQQFWMDGGKWYRVTDIQEALTTDYTLFRDGKLFERAENGHYPEEKDVWKEVPADDAEAYLPWLLRYDWNEESISFHSSETADGSVRITLRVEEEITMAGLTVPKHFLVFEFSGRDVLSSVTLELNSAGESVRMTAGLQSTDRTEIAGVIDEAWQQIAS
ncbi:MAG: hypothetical protein J6B95_09120 [Oscillospiraceae bacterium]|nr:hypothetical protein [Oscillospiraceae bacterium]